IGATEYLLFGENLNPQTRIPLGVFEIKEGVLYRFDYMHPLFLKENRTPWEVLARIDPYKRGDTRQLSRECLCVLPVYCPKLAVVLNPPSDAGQELCHELLLPV